MVAGYAAYLALSALIVGFCMWYAKTLLNDANNS